MAKESGERSRPADRGSLIERIDDHWKVLALLGLVAEGLLVTIVARTESEDLATFGYLLIVFLGVLVLGVVAVTLLERRSTIRVPRLGEAERPNKAWRYDVFLAAPMAGLQDGAAYEASRAEVLRLIEALGEQCGLRDVFYAGRTIRSADRFEDEALSLTDDLEAIRQSRYFVLYYPKPVVTSALLEAGAALALGKPSIYFAAREHLPFLMRNADAALPHVRTYEDLTVDAVVQRICNNRTRLFEMDGARGAPGAAAAPAGGG